MIDDIFEEIRKERQRQNEKWGEQNWPMLEEWSKPHEMKGAADYYKEQNQGGGKFWSSILLEEVYEAFAETKPEKQREEMIQVAAVVVQIIEYLDSRLGK